MERENPREFRNITVRELHDDHIDCSRDLDVGDYIVVRLLTSKSSTKYFVAQVLEKVIKKTRTQTLSGEQEYEVKYLKRQFNHFVFRALDDFSIVEFSSVVQILSPPEVTRRNCLIFADLNFKIE